MRTKSKSTSTQAKADGNDITKKYKSEAELLADLTQRMEGKPAPGVKPLGVPIYAPLYPYRDEREQFIWFGDCVLHHADIEVFQKTVGWPPNKSALKAFLHTYCGIDDPTNWSFSSIIERLRLYVEAGHGHDVGHDVELTDPEWDILRCMHDKGTLLIQSEIANVVDAGDGTIKTSLQNLERWGYVSRPRGKRKGYAITEKGESEVKRQELEAK